LEHALLMDGDAAAATGRVFSDGATVMFEPPMPVALPHYLPGSEPPPRPSHLGVPVAGVDLGALDRRREKAGAIEGWAHLSGVWQDGGLRVQNQEPPIFRGAERLPRWSEPPCPPPLGGWPHGAVDENLDAGDLQEADATIVALALFRPSSTQVVLVIASTEPSRVRAQLRSRFGPRLCVTPSRWTKAQVRDAAAQLRTNMDRWHIYITGETVTEDGQTRVQADTVRVLPEMIDWARPLPDGLVKITPWLAPTRPIEPVAEQRGE
jgi:hypothetical protein